MFEIHVFVTCVGVRACVRVCACLCGEGGIEVPVCRREEREREREGWNN